MTYTIVWLESASAGLRRLRADDPVGVKTLATAVGGLATRPRPENANELGTSGIFRLRIDNVRAVYEVDDEDATVYVLTVGRVSRA